MAKSRKETCRDYYERCRAERRCHQCGKQSEEGKALCAKCSKSKAVDAKRWRDAKKQKGICIKCTEPAVSGLRVCEKHRGQDNSRRKSDRKKKREAGVCDYCSSPSIPGKVYCEKHRQKIIQENKEKRSQAREQGFCETCFYQPGLASAQRDSLVCAKCWLKQVARTTLGEMKRWQELLLLYQYQSVCPYTGKQLYLAVNATLDHIIPRSRGGMNCLDNLQWVYRCGPFDVNRMKGDMTDEEFRAEVSFNCLIENPKRSNTDEEA